MFKESRCWLETKRATKRCGMIKRIANGVTVRRKNSCIIKAMRRVVLTSLEEEKDWRGRSRRVAGGNDRVWSPGWSYQEERTEACDGRHNGPDKAIRSPTDARLYDWMRERLVKSSKARGIQLRQSYRFIGKKVFHR